MAHTIKIMPESEQTRLEIEAEHKHNEALDEATTEVLRTLPNIFRTLKHQLRNLGLETPHKDMGEQQIGVLYALSRGRLLTSELARKFDVTNPTITRTVDGLVERGYVERQPDASDRRKIYLQLTPKGLEVSEFAHVQFRTAMSNMLSRLTSTQLADITLACQHLSTLLPNSVYSYESACPVRPEIRDDQEPRDA